MMRDRRNRSRTGKRQTRVEPLERRELLSNIFSVTNTLDDGSTGSLRWAINQVVGDASDSAASPDQIQFNIPPDDPGYGNGQWRIRLSAALPEITDPVVIDGYTQSGATPNTGGPGSADNAVLKVVIDGNRQKGALHLSGGASTVRGLAIEGFSDIAPNFDAGYAILIDTAGGDTIEGNWLGTNIPIDSDPFANGGPGVEVAGVGGNTIGGTTPDARNVISDNRGGGVYITGAGAQGNLVEGNFIGCDASGTAGVANGGGVAIANGATGTTIGGTAAGAGNLIGGNMGGEVFITTGATGTVVEGNWIGLNITGQAQMPGNSGPGVKILGASGNTVGGTATGAGNVISGNGDGVEIFGNPNAADTFANVIEGNRIGTDPTGTMIVPSYGSGVLIGWASANTVGGTAAGAGNLIAGNPIGGVAIEGPAAGGNVVQGNLVGTDVTGLKALPGPSFVVAHTGGVVLFGGATGNTIGGLTPGAANTIAGNAQAGVLLTEPGTRENVVEGNLIGTGTDGQTGLPNQGPGVLLSVGADANTIGGLAAGAGNVIADNAGAGVRVQDSTTVDDAILGNSIFGNAKLGIDLVGGDEDVFGETANGPGSPQTGPNHLQNHPILNPPTLENGHTNVTGLMYGVPNEAYTIEFFANQTADPSGYGQGQTFLGRWRNITAAPSGQMFFNFLASSDLTGEFLTATATDPNGNTSEFSPDDPQVNVPLSAPNAPVLDPFDDTGPSNSDGVTNHNGMGSRNLQFTVSGVSPLNALVQLYNVNDPSHPVPIPGSLAQAIGGSATINVTNSTPLPDGTYKIAAAAALNANGPWSAFSPATTVTIQTSLRVLSITPSGNFYTSLPNNGQVTVTFSEPLAGVTNNAQGFANVPFAVMLIPSGPDGAVTQQQTGVFWSAPSGIDDGDLPLPATVKYTENADGTSTLTLTPHQPLATDVYLISVGGVTDLAGNPVADAGGKAGSVYSSFDYRPSPTDGVAPTVTGVSAFDGSVTIGSGASIPQPDTIGIAFSKPMDAYTINSSTVHLLAVNSTNGAVNDLHEPVVYSPSTQTAYLTPAGGLNVGTTYTILVDSTVTDDEGFPNPGVPLAHLFERTFTVNTPIAGFGSAPFAITATNPPDGSVRTRPLGYGSITFSERVTSQWFQRFTAMMVAQTGGVTTGSSGYADVPYNAKLAFSYGTNSLIIVPTGLLPNNVVNLFAVPQIQASDREPLADSHVPPGYRTFKLSIGAAPATVHANRGEPLVTEPTAVPPAAAPVVHLGALPHARARSIPVTRAVSSAHRARPAQAVLTRPPAFARSGDHRISLAPRPVPTGPRGKV